MKQDIDQSEEYLILIQQLKLDNTAVRNKNKQLEEQVEMLRQKGFDLEDQV